jgi:hypothetical protein
MLSKSVMISALRVVIVSGALPATVVMPTKLVCRAATTIAIASSWPGSQSRMIDGFDALRGDVLVDDMA